MNETFLEPSMKFYNITFDTNSTDWTIFSNIELNLVKRPPVLRVDIKGISNVKMENESLL